MSDSAIHTKFSAALDALIQQIKADRSVLAALLCGSLSHDTVWAKSDIDLVLVTIDDKNIEQGDLALNADGVNVHAILVPRREFRKLVDGSAASSTLHAFLAKGRLLYAHDETIAPLLATLTDVGQRDVQLQILRAAAAALPAIYKAHKWLTTRADLEYTAFWILAASTSLARMEVLTAGLVADREVIPQALTLNPAFFKIVYTDLLNAPKTTGAVQLAVDALDGYLASRATTVFRPVLDYLQDVAEARSCRELEDYFKRNLDLEGVTTVCEYLADQGLIGKAATPARLTKRSNVQVEELAFYYVERAPTA
jgi:hypothetical protein